MVYNVVKEIIYIKKSLLIKPKTLAITNQKLAIYAMQLVCAMNSRKEWLLLEDWVIK